MSSQRKVFVVGSGGREHALSLRLLESASVAEVVCCPGNPGMLQLPGDLIGKSIRLCDGDALTAIGRERPDLVVIGPEVPLCAGLADQVRAQGIACYGPSEKAAQLEGSKAYMKAFCLRHGIPTAREVVVTSAAQLVPALASFEVPPVVKADGLCAGKGVVVAESFAEAESAARSMLDGSSFGAAGNTVVLEERLIGSEASVHAICDGKTSLILPVAQDHKRIFDGDMGPNTGGMGAYAPAPLVDAPLLERIRTEIVDRALAGMIADGVPFIGTLFVGLMIDAHGEPRVLEFNVRFGDPETQVLMMVLDGDLGETLYSAALGDLAGAELSVTAEHAICVVLAAPGYPEDPQKGDAISGLEAAAEIPFVRIFHAGTSAKAGQVVTAGGRVLGVTARGATLAEARDRAYRAAELIQFRGKQMRRDIGHRALTSSY